MNPDTSLKLLAILPRADHAAFAASATGACYAAEDVEVSLMEGGFAGSDTDRAVCELVAYIRRIRPQVVITSGPWDASGDKGRATTSQLATAAVMRAADPRYGHTCSSRGAYSVSKLYYTAINGPVTTRIETDAFYRLFSTVNMDQVLEADLFEGVRESSRQFAAAA